MDNALILGLSRQSALQRELDVVANNIANVTTTGFKADNTIFASLLQPGASPDPLSASGRRANLGNMTWHDMGQGTIQQTGGPLDVAIDGDGMLVVQTAQGERYTRNGALQLNNLGELVTLSGDKVLGENGPIVLQPTDRDVVISKNGIIKVREGVSLNSDTTRGKLRLVKFESPQQLSKQGGSSFAAPDGVVPIPVPEKDTHVVQGAIEKSNVRPVAEMSRMIELTRSYTEVATMLQQQSELRKNSLQQLSDVPA